MINIIYEDNHLLVVEKPVGILSQSDSTGDDDMLSILKKYIKKKYNKPGNVYLGLVHRLDRPTGGIMVFAKTSKCAKRLSSQIKNHEFKKKYFAVCEGKISGSGKFEDNIIKDKKLNKSFVSSAGKEAVLYYNSLGYKSGYSLLSISLETGRSHQIRVQCSSRGYPLYGDFKYNFHYEKGNLALFAYMIVFHHPISKELMEFSLPLPNRYPFSLFKDSI